MTTQTQPWIPLHRRLEFQAAKAPGRIALVHGTQRLTYEALNARANQFAHELTLRGVGPGDLIAVCLPRSCDLVAAIIATLKVGAAYVPVDPEYPAERVDYLLQNSAPAAAFVQQEENFQRLAGRCICVTAMHAQNAGNLVESVTEPADRIYVIYTSGSTGRPKGAINHHLGFGNLLDWYINEFELDERDCVMIVTSPSFDLTQKNFFAPLLVGGKLVLSDQSVFDPGVVAEIIAREGVTVLNLTPSMFTSLVEAAAPASLSSVRRVFLGGEPIHLQALQGMHARYPNIELVNSYGPTECADVACYHRIHPDWSRYELSPPPIGKAIPGARMMVLDANLQLVAAGEKGDIYIGGMGVGLGYLGQPELTAERFIEHPSLGRIYRTGDIGKWLPEGDLGYLGRSDFQLKIRGFRIEPGEIEDVLRGLPGVENAVVSARAGTTGEAQLVAHVLRAAASAVTAAGLRTQLGDVLPSYMVPSAFVLMDRFPLSPNGKVDRQALPDPEPSRPDLSVPCEAPRTRLEQAICDGISELLGIEPVGRLDSFFELGGSSLQAVQLARALSAHTGRAISPSMIFAHPAASDLAASLDGAQQGDKRFIAGSRRAADIERGIPRDTRAAVAIIGVAGRFPGADSVDALWSNLLAEVDGITHFAPGKLDAGIPSELLDDPNYVRARGVIDGHDLFDNAFFGVSAREAALLDPQHRLMLETAWECLENGGYAPGDTDRPVGIFAGIYGSYYLQRQLMRSPGLIDKAGELPVLLANDKDYAILRVADKLHLTGPAVAVHTSCSTSLTAIAQAVDSLRLGRCDMALAGGVTIVSPPNTGYLYQEGGMLSRDGQTRSFDAEATGTVFNDGAAMVLLKRVDDALREGDHILAIIEGIAVNNDGGGKASFSAPSVDGQAAVIIAALEEAGVDPREIDYVEAHGTATPLGDPIEVEALTRAWRKYTRDTGFCRIGSIKSNIGHVVTAAGAAALIKTALALHHETIPASLHFNAPNPQIDFASTPFIVNARRTSWVRSADCTRRAGVSNFGVGGTNVHAIVREAPERPASSEASGAQLLLLSGRTSSALASQAEHLAAHLQRNPGINLADVAHTLQHGRSRFAHRLAVAGSSVTDALEALRQPGHRWRAQAEPLGATPELIWLFPGQGSQYPRMGTGLHVMDPVFRAAFDAALAACAPHTRFNLKMRIFEGDANALVDTSATQPAIFCVGYALAQAWMARGAMPTALIGHSVGEFVAAVVSGVMSLEDAARLVTRRGALMGEMPAGSMLAVRLGVREVLELLPQGLSLAAENSPTACVVAGPSEQVREFHSELEAAGVPSRLLHTSHAFHSSMMDGVLEPFAAELASVTLSPPQLPIVSTQTGTWLSDEQATSASYWVRHLREPVRFSPALRQAAAHHPAAVFVELGPRGTLTALARQHVTNRESTGIKAVASLGEEPELEFTQLLLAQGVLWTLGLELPGPAANPAEQRRRVPLPTYPFERKRFWVGAQATPATLALPPAADGVPHRVTQQPFTMDSAMSTAQSATTAPRSHRLVDRLREVFQDISGSDLQKADSEAAFVELGIDSLALTQVALHVKRQFGVPVTFRQLMEDLRNFELLAAYLDTHMPPEATAAAAELAAAEPVPSVAESPTLAQGQPSLAQPGSVHWVIQQQMQLMAQQLALLGAPSTNSPACAAAAQIPAPPLPPGTPAAPASIPAADGEMDGSRRYDVKKAFGAIARIHTIQAGPLSERQKARLAAFVRRYVERTGKSRAYTTAYRNHLADPRVVNGFRPLTKEITYQIVVERSKGSHLWDLDGNEYVDVLSGFGMSLVGWQADFVLEALRRQLDSGYDIGPQHPLAGPVADMVCELTGFDRAGLCNTGSEAVMAALRIARTVTGRDTVVLFTGSYHGTFDEVVVRAGRDAKGIPGAPGIMRGMFGDVRVLEYGTPESLAFIREHAGELAAVLVEPVQSRRPEFRPVEFLKDVRAVTEQNGCCLIFDEVITGFRSALGGTQELFGIRADLATYGKVIGGGMPIGVVAGKRAYMDALDGGAWQYGDDSIPTVGVTYFAGTFVRHPLALAAAHASLRHLKERGPTLQQELNARTTALAEELSAFCREVGAPLEVRHFSSLWRVSWLEDHPLQDLLFAMMRSRGVHILDNFPCFLTTAHTEADIRLVAEAFKESVRELQESEFLPRRTSPVAMVFDASKPPVPGARLGKDASGKPAWFVPHPENPSKYMKVSA